MPDKKSPNKKKEKKQITPAQFEERVSELAKEGLSAEKIGEKLKAEDIHAKEYSKKISEILKKEKVYENPVVKNLEIKLGRISKHLEKNKQDKRAMREKIRISSQISKNKKYLQNQL